MHKRFALLLFVAMLAMGGMWTPTNAASTVADPSCLYFAHPINTYDTELEEALLERIRETFPRMRILNPNDPQYSEGWGRYQQQYGNPMLYFVVEIMPICTGGTIALPYRDGMWSPGVFFEMMETYTVDRPVWTITPDGRIRRENQLPSGLLTLKENRAYSRKPY